MEVNGRLVIIYIDILQITLIKKIQRQPVFPESLSMLLMIIRKTCVFSLFYFAISSQQELWIIQDGWRSVPEDTFPNSIHLYCISGFDISKPPQIKPKLNTMRDK